MAFYLVGKDNGTFFKKRTTWDLDVALEMAVDGDTIEIEFDYLYSRPESLIISKSVSIIGQTKTEGESVLVAAITCPVIVNQQATVKFENLMWTLSTDQSNALLVCEQATVHAVRCVFSNVATSGENYPIIYVDGGSYLEMLGSKVNLGSNPDNHRLYVEQSTIRLHDCLIEASLVLSQDTKYLIEATQIIYPFGNVLNCEGNSSGKAINTIFRGGVASENVPCVYLENSQLNLADVQIRQSKYDSALCALDSHITVTKTTIDSLSIYRSQMAVPSFVVFSESCAIKDNSILQGGEAGFFGYENGKVNLFASEGSQIELKRIFMAQLSQPAIKLERNVSFSVPTIKVVKFDSVKQTIVGDEQGNFVEEPIEISIERFGDKTSYELLEEMIGLDSVKRGVKEFIAINKLNKRREQEGYGTSSATMHALFLGNPGTGKTTVARLIGKLLKEEGLIEKGQFVETSRSDLVGQYIGETAQKTREILESALGGVLFIDEAYTLASQDNSRDFGIEAINEILKFMEDHRRDIVIIFAGYTKNMEDFLKMNEGLRSRIPNNFIFEDYTVPQLVRIGLDELTSQGYKINEEQYADLVEYKHQLTNDNSNGRWVRNLNESLLRTLAISLLDYPNKDINHIDNDVITMVKSR